MTTDEALAWVEHGEAPADADRQTVWDVVLTLAAEVRRLRDIDKVREQHLCEIVNLQADLAAARAEVERLEAQLSSTRADLHLTLKTVTTQQDELDAARAEAARFEGLMVKAESEAFDARAEVARLQDALILVTAQARRLEHDIQAYRGALGYSVPGNHDGRLSDGTVPSNGIADAVGRQRDNAQREVARLREAIHRALDSLCVMGSEDIDTLTAALAGSSIHCHGCTVSVMPGESSGYSRGFCQRCVNEGRAI